MTTGKTKDAGWQLGVSRTVPRSPEDVWDHVVGDGIVEWLGKVELGDAGDEYETADGVRGEVRSRTEGVRVRLTWQPSDRSHASTLQLTIRPAASGTTIGIHHERLRSAAERAEMLTHWTSVIDRMAATLTG